MTVMNEELYISDWELGVVRLEDATEERHGVAGNDDIIRTSLIPAAAQPSGLHNSPVTVNKGTVLFANLTRIVLYLLHAIHPRTMEPRMSRDVLQMRIMCATVQRALFVLQPQTTPRPALVEPTAT